MCTYVCVFNVFVRVLYVRDVCMCICNTFTAHIKGVVVIDGLRINRLHDLHFVCTIVSGMVLLLLIFIVLDAIVTQETVFRGIVE